MIMKCIIRNMKFSDINTVIELNTKFLPENYEKEVWIHIFNKYKIHCFVASISNIVVGYILSGELNGINSIISIAVENKYRNNNIGLNLINHYLNSYNYGDIIKLHCRKNNKAYNLYKKCDFIVEELLEDYYINPTDDAYVMSNKLCKKYIIHKKLSILI